MPEISFSLQIYRLTVFPSYLQTLIKCPQHFCKLRCAQQPIDVVAHMNLSCRISRLLYHNPIILPDLRAWRPKRTQEHMISEEGHGVLARPAGRHIFVWAVREGMICRQKRRPRIPRGVGILIFTLRVWQEGDVDAAGGGGETTSYRTEGRHQR